MIEARTEHDAVVRMMDGEDLLAGLSGLEIDSAVVVCGIGMLRELELGYWNGAEYEKHRIEQPVELVSLQGTIAQMDGERVVHLHVIGWGGGSAIGTPPWRSGTARRVAGICSQERSTTQRRLR